MHEALGHWLSQNWRARGLERTRGAVSPGDLEFGADALFHFENDGRLDREHRGAGPSTNWVISTRRLADLRWSRLDLQQVKRAELIDSPGRNRRDRSRTGRRKREMFTTGLVGGLGKASGRAGLYRGGSGRGPDL